MLVKLLQDMKPLPAISVTGKPLYSAGMIAAVKFLLTARTLYSTPSTNDDIVNYGKNKAFKKLQKESKK